MIPYGVLWELTNPQYWTVNYGMLLFILDTFLTIINFKFLKYHIFLLWTSMELFWFTSGIFQNISVFWLTPYPIIGALWTILQKLPIGYYPILNNQHVHCAITCQGGNWLKGTSPVEIWSLAQYTIILIWTIVPTLYWLKRRKRKEIQSLAKLETSFLKSISFLLIGISWVLFFIYVAVYNLNTLNYEITYMNILSMIAGFTILSYGIRQTRVYLEALKAKV